MSSTTSNLARSVEYRLWQLLYLDGWCNTFDGVALQPMTGQTLNGTVIPANSYGMNTGLPWSWWNVQASNPARNVVTVYRNGLSVNPSTYAINFLGGYVTFNSPMTGNMTADLIQFAVNVTPGYPEDERLAAAQLPIVAFDVSGRQGTPIVIGTTACDWQFPLAIDILAINNVQRQDLMDTIATKIVQVPLLDCGDAWLLDENGDVDQNFNVGLQLTGWMRPDPYPRGHTLQPRHNGSDKERYRAMVSVGLKKVE